MPSSYTKANRAWMSVIVGGRKAAGLSQEDLAKRCRMNQQDISKIETGRRPLRAAEIPMMAEALKTKPEALFEQFLAFYRA